MKALMTRLMVTGILLAGSVSATLAGRFTTQQEQEDSWPVRLAYWKEKRDPDLKLKRKVTASIENRALTLRDVNGTMVAIPGESIRSVFYDRALWKKYLKKAARPQPGEVKRKTGYLTAEAGLATYGAVASSPL